MSDAELLRLVIAAADAADNRCAYCGRNAGWRIVCQPCQDQGIRYDPDTGIAEYDYECLQDPCARTCAGCGETVRCNPTGFKWETEHGNAFCPGNGRKSHGIVWHDPIYGDRDYDGEMTPTTEGH